VTKNAVQNVHRQPAHELTKTTTPLTNRCCDDTMMSSLDTALSSKQEKYLPTCMLGSLRWSMPKSTKSDAKLSKICERNEWHLFPGNVIYDF